jgi:hypothetical protein
MGNDLLYLVDLANIQLDENGQVTSSWVHALPLGEYIHPVFGKISVTPDKVKRFADNVKNKVRGIDPSINYNHNNEDVASGWVKDAEPRDTGLWLFVEWTKNAVEKIKNKEYRYFSAEYHDKWKNAEGQEVQDVLFGGALTNRPYMKNLLPINLSEKSVDYAFGLVDAITKAKEGSVDMDLKKFNEVLGLPADTSEEDALKALAEKLNPKPQDDKGKKPEVPAVKVSDELKQLAEENPVVRALIETVDAQNTALREFQSGLMEADISKKLAEFDNSKIVLTPRAKDMVHDFLLEAPTALHEKFWDILGLMRNSSGLMVELGERAGANPKYGRAKDSVSLFMDESNKYAQDNKVSFDEAMVAVSRQNPDLWNEYRKGTYAFSE